MRKVFFTVLSCFILVLDLVAQCPFPVRVEIGNLSPSISNSDRDLDENPAAYYSPYVENFHAIGWSADGKAAYMVWGEAQATCHFGVVIYDVVKDQVAGKWFENMGDNNSLEVTQIPVFWQRDKDSILPLLKKFNINCGQGVDYSNFPVQHAGKTFSTEYQIFGTDTLARSGNTGAEGICVIADKNKSDTVKFTWSGFNALDIQPAGIWFSPDGKYALMINYTETYLPGKGERPHSYEYFVRSLALK